MKKFPDKWVYFPVFVLGIILIIKLVQFSKIIYYFPLHAIGDAVDHISKLYFLSEYGFHGFVPNWYNGFILFQNYPPGYYYFCLPFYLLINHLQLTTYLVLVLSFILGFIGIVVLCRIHRMSFVKSMAFFLFLFANPIFIGYFAEIGRLSAVFSWLVVFIPFCIVIFWYKEHKIDFKFVLFPLLLSALILTHIFVLIPAVVLVISLFLVKKAYGKILIIFSTFLSLIITSFWWIPFLKTSLSLNRHVNYLAGEILTLQSFFSYNTLILFIFWFTLYFYLKSKPREMIFFLPPLILSILFFSRLIVFIPLLNRIPPSPYNIFFLFLSICLFFKTSYPLIIRRLMLLGLVVLTVGSAIIIYQMGSQLEYTENEREIISIFSEIEGKFIVVGAEKISSRDALVAYASVYHNLSSPSGHYPKAAKKEVIEKLEDLNKHFKMRDCDTFLLDLKGLGVREIISVDEHCDFLASCNLQEKIKKQHACLYSFNKG